MHLKTTILSRYLPLLLSLILVVSGLFLSPPDTLAATSQSATSSESASVSESLATSGASAGARKKKGKRKSSRKRSSSSRKRKSSKKRNTSARRSAAPKQEEERPSYDSLTLLINSAVVASIPENMNPGGLRVNKVNPDKRHGSVGIQLNENFTYLPVTNDLIKEISKTVEKALPDSVSDLRVNLRVGNRSLGYYITKVDKLPEKYRKNTPFVYPTKPYINPKKGMEGDIIALWSSHGRYYKNGAWQWQRPLLFETCEDELSMGFVLPYIAPMLENAGAYVMMPRERDINVHEVIVDNDTNEGGELYSQPWYREMNGAKTWATGEYDGFIYDLKDFRDTENPFEVGTYRQVGTVRSGKPSVAAWYADIPEDGEYAVYVSYKTLPNSTEDARYTVNYSGGSREFTVNQTMGGGTWIYLGTFPFEKGYSDTEAVVTLTNLTDKGGDTVVTADAVKIGGGMGNIARSPRRADVYYDPSTPETTLASASTTDNSVEGDDEEDDEGDDEGDDEDDGTADDASEPTEPAETTPEPAQPKGVAPTFRTSGYPRYLEGARYWLHWAGFPEYVYSPYHGSDDYKDDYTSRGLWVNYLMGGSRVLPGKEGLNIPVDAVMALHTDAGKRADDSIVGTLGIYFTNGGDSYADGTQRINSRMLTDMLMRQITGDLRQTYDSNWTRRSMWDKSYVEARVPEVPTSLIELLSHQNFGDMRYALDPGFRFTVGRAVYKALARFVAERKDRDVVIQPLPVHDFSIHRTSKNHYRLEWKATPDPLEPTAHPTKYIIFERSEGVMGFSKIGETSQSHYDVKVADHKIHSFKVVAANDGGLSFPSEILSLREAPDGKSPVLIVNGFTRVSAPGSYATESTAGFTSEDDFGVPYVRDISFTGHQTEFRRSAGESFGRSGSGYATSVIAGNTFDFPMVHGRSIADAGYGFVSTSVGAVEDGTVNLHDYKVVDLILGKQKMTVTGRGKSGVRFRAFPEALRSKIRSYTDKGGNLFVSGQYVASDLRSDEEKTFGREVLGLDTVAQSRSRSGRIEVNGSRSTSPFTSRTYQYSNTLNDKQYVVENPDALTPAEGVQSDTVMTFTDTGAPAAIMTKRGRSRAVVMSVPFESLKDANQRDILMQEILQALE